MRVSFKEKALSASAYFFGIPALYIVLTGNRKKDYVGGHGTRAFSLWVSFFAIFFAIRFSIDLIWRVSCIPQLEMFEVFSAAAMACYALFCGFQIFFNKGF